MKTFNKASIAMVVLALVSGCGQSQSSSGGGTPGNPAGVAHLYDGACDLLGVPYGGGTGTSGSPFLICTPKQLSAILAQPAAYFALTDDLDFTGNTDYVAVPNLDGTFDGGNHKIVNWTNGLGGLFLQATGKIQNLVIENATITGSYRSGLLVGTLESTGVVDNVIVSGTINSAYSSGGLVGINYGTIQNSSANVNIAGVDYIGGLAGWNSGTISNCFSTGSVLASGTGIVGTNSYGVVGGLVAGNYGGTIVHSYSMADVTGVPEVGGLVGENQNKNYSTTHTPGVISQSYATGGVTGTTQVGGLVGYNWSGTVTNSYARNAVAYIAVTGVSAGAFGGLIGANGFSQGTTTSPGTVLNSYCATSLSVPGPSTGGLLGQNILGSTTNSYFDQSVAGTGVTAGGTAQTTGQMMTQSTYAGWDFAAVWSMPTNGYPQLH